MKTFIPWISIVITAFCLGFFSGKSNFIGELLSSGSSLNIDSASRVYSLVNELAAIRTHDTQAAIRSMELELMTHTAILADSAPEQPENQLHTHKVALGMARAYLERFPTDYTEVHNQLMPRLLAYKIPDFQEGTCYPATRKLLTGAPAASQEEKEEVSIVSRQAPDESVNVKKSTSP